MYDPLPRIINLLTDLKEERDMGPKADWVAVPMTKIILEFEQSLKRYPPTKMGTPEPYSSHGQLGATDPAIR
jgi:arylsulfatase